MCYIIIALIKEEEKNRNLFGFCFLLPTALQKYPRGSRGSPAKGVASVMVARVQISSSAPDVNNTNLEFNSEFVLFFDNEYFGRKIDR